MINTDTQTPVSVHPRYAGLPGLALGGYSSGLLAQVVDPSGVKVRLRRPVPLERELTAVHTDPGYAELFDGETLLAEAAAAKIAVEVPEAPGFAEASAASEHFPGHHGHPYGECFACGPERAEGDGLRVFPGELPNRRLLAAAWTPPDEGRPGEPVGLELIWSAFDCAQLWALMVHEPSPGERIVTAELAGAVERPVMPGVPHVLAAWSMGRDGNTLRAGAALFDPKGELRAVGVQTAVISKWGVPLDFTLQ
jgi:hypothetical protein